MGLGPYVRDLPLGARSSLFVEGGGGARIGQGVVTAAAGADDDDGGEGVDDDASTAASVATTTRYAVLPYLTGKMTARQIFPLFTVPPSQDASGSGLSTAVSVPGTAIRVPPRRRRRRPDGGRGGVVVVVGSVLPLCRARSGQRWQRQRHRPSSANIPRPGAIDHPLDP